jgi:hypothetical protein
MVASGEDGRREDSVREQAGATCDNPRPQLEFSPISLLPELEIRPSGAILIYEIVVTSMCRSCATTSNT